MLKLHHRLQEGRFPNYKKLAEELEVSAKTIQRDMDFMRDQFNLPIAYDEKHFGFYYTEPVLEFPGMEITEGEVVALFIAQQALSQYSGAPFASALKATCARLAEQLKSTITVNLDDLAFSLSFRQTGEAEISLEAFRLLHGAVQESEEIEFDYRGIEDDGFKRRHVQPYHLACIENQWYLFAFDLDRQSMRRFVLCRLANPKLSQRKFKRPEAFNLKDFLSESFRVFSKTGEYHICVRFDGFAARFVSERKWHSSQKLKWVNREELDFYLTLGSLEEIQPWIQSWGEHAMVIGPPELKKRIAEAARKVVSRYRAAKLATERKARVHATIPRLRVAGTLKRNNTSAA